MIPPFHHTAMTATIPSCDTADSHAVLEAARAAMPVDAAEAYLHEAARAGLTPRQRPLVPLLMALLDSAAATARAISDNARDEGTPIAASLANELANQCREIAGAVVDARIEELA